MEHDGSAEANPTVTFVFGTGTTVTDISFEDPSGRLLEISTAITDADILIIDSEQKIVTLNGVETDYTGAFPIFTPGSNSFTVTIT